jgi:hypothetical protein
MQLSRKTINEGLKRLGYNAVLTKGDGYFYFEGGEASDWLDRTVRIAALKSLTLDQWIARYKELQAKNKSLVKSRIGGKSSTNS